MIHMMFELLFARNISIKLSLDEWNCRHSIRLRVGSIHLKMFSMSSLNCVFYLGVNWEHCGVQRMQEAFQIKVKASLIFILFVSHKRCWELWPHGWLDFGSKNFWDQFIPSYCSSLLCFTHSLLFALYYKDSFTASLE